jgi:methyltransferase (TIGR00027 family)
LLEAVRRGAGTVLNLGAGLDTRPYRLAVPASLRWVEVDVPKIIDHKNALLRDERPACQLQRIAADLSDDAARRDVLARIGDVDHDVIVLTEGVLAYLTERAVGALAEDLHREQRFRSWIIDYSARFLNIAVHVRRLHRRDVKNAPLRFGRVDWPEFYRARGWGLVEQRHLPIEGERLGRPLPMPWWFSPVHALLPERARGAIRSMIGFARLQRE